MFSLPLAAQDVASQDRMPTLLQNLKEAQSAEAAKRVVRDIRLEWSKSGSAAMDLLLNRGRDALERGALKEAVEHLTALTDHAPDFAEGWHARAMAYYRQERFGQSAADLERTLALNPDHFGAIRGIGAIYEHLNRPELAYRAYALAAEYYPHDEEIKEALKRLKTRAVGVDL